MAADGSSRGFCPKLIWRALVTIRAQNQKYISSVASSVYFLTFSYFWKHFTDMTFLITAYFTLCSSILNVFERIADTNVSPCISVTLFESVSNKHNWTVCSTTNLLLLTTKKTPKSRVIGYLSGTQRWPAPPHIKGQWFEKRFIVIIIYILTHWGRDKLDTISQTTFSSAFSWMKMFEFKLKFHWSLFLRVQLTSFQHWFR